ncbi:MAG: hypothetical protein LBR08_10220 [Bacteroidales bacterium]|jgi:hypothetical protein|nr:hypothetical protein [Bacteroidales bacterium]
MVISTVDRAIPKVNRVTQKSIGLTSNSPEANLFAQANGKLCFEYLKTFSVPENQLAPLPDATGGNASEVGISVKYEFTGLQQ